MRARHGLLALIASAALAALALARRAAAAESALLTRDGTLYEISSRPTARSPRRMAAGAVVCARASHHVAGGDPVTEIFGHRSTRT